MSRLTMSLLGAPRIERDGVPTALDTRKAIALLAYLAITGDHQSRETLMALLWPEADQLHARNTLRYTLSVLKKAIGGAWLDVGRESVRLHRSPDLWLDVDHFHSQLAACRMHGHRETDVCPACLPALTESVLLYRTDFLAGFTLRDSPAFDEWQLFQAERLRGELASALERLVQAHTMQGTWEPAIDYAQRWVALDPLHEPAQRQLMQVYAWAGRRAAALRQYRSCARVIEHELGISPSEETTQLYEALKERRIPQLEVAASFQPLVAQDTTDLPPQSPRIPRLAEEPAEVEQNVFVAREGVLARLGAFLNAAIAGHGQVVFVTGEAGSGKTALLQEFARRALDAHTDLIIASGNCNAHTGIGDPFLPFREALNLLMGDVDARSSGGVISLAYARRLRALLPAALPALVDAGPALIDTFVPGAPLAARAATVTPRETGWLARLEQLLERKAAAGNAPGLDQQKVFEQYTNVLTTLAAQRPLLLAIDDLQWADAASISLLFHLSRRIESSRILLLGSYRPDDVAIGRGGARHPLEPVVNELRRYVGDVWVDLDQAAEAEGRQFVAALLDSEPNRLRGAFREALYRQTEGHPLFTVELLRGLQARGDLLQDQDGRWIEGAALDWETLPARVEGAIAERIGRLDEALQEALAVASVEGEEFTAEVVARVQAADARALVQRLSGELDRRHWLVRAQGTHQARHQRLSRYRFRHFLFQKYLYSHLDPGERAYLHEDVGNALEGLYEEWANTIAVQLARHFEAAGRVEKAINYLLRAGHQALRLSANTEAIAHFRKGLALLETLPDTPERARQELALQSALSVPLLATRGYASADVEQVYSRARELCRQIGETPDLYPVLMGLRAFYLVRARHQTSCELGQLLLQLAQNAPDPTLRPTGHWALGVSFVHMGAFVAARTHLGQMIAFYDPQRHHSLAFRYGTDPGVTCRAWDAWALWFLGYSDQALQKSNEALALAQALSHPFSLASARFIGAALHIFRRDRQAAQEWAEATVTLSTEQGYTYTLALGTILQGWALAAPGHEAAGIAQIRQGLAAMRATGAEIGQPHFLALLAEVYGIVGQTEEGLTLLAEALVIARDSRERYYEAELYRLKGELLLKHGTVAADAEACFRQAIAIAHDQQAKSWELRAVTSLSGLLRSQGKVEEARHMLAEIYGWFSEGVDTPDLKEARALLESLS